MISRGTTTLSALLALALGLTPACSSSSPVRLEVQEPCEVRALARARTLVVSARGAGLASPWEERFAWPTGVLELSLPHVRGATVGVAALDAGGAIVATAGAGLLDLDVDRSRIVLSPGPVDGFASTTAPGGACAVMATPRRAHAAVPLSDGRVLVAAGQTETPEGLAGTSTSELFEPRTGTFAPGPPLGAWPRVGLAGVALADGGALLTGGLDPVVGRSWRLAQLIDGTSLAVQAVAMKNERAYHTATRLDDGRVLLAGGVADRAELSTTELFDPVTGRFASGPELSAPRAHHAAVLVAPSTVALIGGVSAGEVLGTVELVQLGPDGVSPGPKLRVPRTDLAAALVPGVDAIAVIGGLDAPADDLVSGTGIADLELIALARPDLSASTQVCPGLRLAVARGAPGIAVVEGGVLVVGGVVTPGVVTGKAERVSVTDLATCAVTITSTAGDLVTPRAGARLAKLVGGDVLVTGGVEPAGKGRGVASGEVWAPPPR